MKSRLANYTISLLGCGWLGLPLAEALINKGYVIKGSTTSKNKLQLLKQKGIIPYQIRISENNLSSAIEDFLSNTHSLIITIPPGLRTNPNKNYVAEMSLLLKAIAHSAIKQVLYISSTSVFADTHPFSIITEDSLPNNNTANAKQLIAVEQLFFKAKKIQSTILRFGGLINNKRHPGKFLSGKTQLSNPLAPINLIHQDDCIGIILQIIKDNHWGRIFSAVYPFHPNKKDYYTQYCKQQQLSIPEFNLEGISYGKQINSASIKKTLQYSFTTQP